MHARRITQNRNSIMPIDPVVCRPCLMYLFYGSWGWNCKRATPPLLVFAETEAFGILSARILHRSFHPVFCPDFCSRLFASKRFSVYGYGCLPGWRRSLSSGTAANLVSLAGAYGLAERLVHEVARLGSAEAAQVVHESRELLGRQQRTRRRLAEQKGKCCQYLQPGGTAENWNGTS